MLPYNVPNHTRVSRSILRQFFRILFHVLGPVEINGKENIPESGGYLVVYNHVSMYDPPFLIAFWPKSLEAIAAAEVWSKPGQSTLVKLYGTIPVHRGQYDRIAISTMVNILNSDFPLAMAPEGGRSHVPGLRRALPGVSYILDITQKPVVPVGITGTTDDYFNYAIKGKRPIIKMNIGKTLRLPTITGKGKSRREQRQANADLIMSHIATQLPQEYRGIYANQCR